jgi:DNA repair exonuclease SbcCD ATPase subunit
MVTMKSDDLAGRPISDLSLTRMARHREELNTQKASAKLHVERLKQKQSEMEREEQMIADLLEKQDQYERGKQEMQDRLEESLVSLQKMGDHAARQVEVYFTTRDRLAADLEELQKINDTEWADESLREELNKAVVQIDTIRSDFVKAQATIEAVGGPVHLFAEHAHKPSSFEEDEFVESNKGFGHWFKIGLAFSLPLILTILCAVIIFAVKGR